MNEHNIPQPIKKHNYLYKIRKVRKIELVIKVTQSKTSI